MRIKCIFSILLSNNKVLVFVKVKISSDLFEKVNDEDIYEFVNLSIY